MSAIETEASAGAQEYEGPYESWIFENGKEYKHPGLERTARGGGSGHQAQSPAPSKEFLSCVFERPEGADQSTFEDALKDGKPPVHFPVRWQSDAFKPHFYPVVIEKELNLESSSPPSFLSSLTLLSSVLPFIGNDSEEALRPTYRANLPVRGETFNPDWDDKKHEVKNGSKEEIVIVAVIDDGVPFAHRNFANSAGTGTRVEYCWSQSAIGDLGQPMLFGREFDKETIDDVYKACDGDESAIYRKAGLTGNGRSRLRMPLDKQYSHGAHVLDTLAGNQPGLADGDEDRVHIIAVDLPAMSSSDTSGFGKDMFMLAAMHYIFDRADKIAARYATEDSSVPLIVNLSYGHSGGPHDGTGLVEAAFDEMIEARRTAHPTALVMPTGNSFQHHVHAVVNQYHFEKAKKKKQKSVEFDWFLPPNDRTSSYLEIWFPVGFDPSSADIRLIPPKVSGLDRAGYGMPPGFKNNTSNNKPIQHNGQTIGQLSTENYRGKRWRHVIALAPTEVEGASSGVPAGKWTLQFEKKDGKAYPEYTDDTGDRQAGGIQLWIQRDEDFGAAGTGARQSSFVDGKNDLRNRRGAPRTNDSTYKGTRVRRFGTLSGMATGKYTLRVGGYIEQTLAAASYSSAGALRHDDKKNVIPAGRQVSVSGVSERSFVHRGVVAAGTRTGTNVALSGTSSAAPQVARALADYFLHNSGEKPSVDGNYAEVLQAQVASLTVGDRYISDPRGPERLGRYLARKPRRETNYDDASRIEKLVVGQTAPPAA